MPVEHKKPKITKLIHPQLQTFTKKQKEKLIKRFENEMILKEKEFEESVDNEIKILKLKFQNRLNKILRKFWDVKLEDILNIEREMSHDSQLTLFHIIELLEKSKSEKSLSD